MEDTRHTTKLQGWLRRVQRGSNERKRRWLIVLSAGAMALVLFVWVFYLDFRLPRVEFAKNAGEGEIVKEEVETEEASFFEVMTKGFRVIGGQFKEEVRRAQDGFTKAKDYVEGRLGGAREIIIEPEKQ